LVVDDPPLLAEEFFNSRTWETHLFPPAVLNGLFVMATFAERLPVRLIPEEFGITFVRDNVVHNGCGSQYSQDVALGAEWTLSEKFPPCFAPSGTVAPCGRRTSLAVQFSPFLDAMPLASAVTGINKRRAAGVSAWMFRGVRHLL